MECMFFRTGDYKGDRRPYVLSWQGVISVLFSCVFVMRGAASYMVLPQSLLSVNGKKKFRKCISGIVMKMYPPWDTCALFYPRKKGIQSGFSFQARAVFLFSSMCGAVFLKPAVFPVIM